MADNNRANTTDTASGEGAKLSSGLVDSLGLGGLERLLDGVRGGGFGGGHYGGEMRRAGGSAG
jgi:hypothetical protein